MDIRIWLEEHGDAASIDAVTVAALLNAELTSHTEQLVVDGLRKSGMLTVSLVADRNEEIVGHVAVSPVVISDGSSGWFGLGPLSVKPECQRQGIGSRLMSAALDRLREMGAAGCVVVGDPRYYGRFGFKPEPGRVLQDFPPEYFMAVAFGPSLPRGSVAYHEAFKA
jgi:putative acetyltransferase